MDGSLGGVRLAVDVAAVVHQHSPSRLASLPLMNVATDHALQPSLMVNMTLPFSSRSRYLTPARSSISLKVSRSVIDLVDLRGGGGSRLPLADLALGLRGVGDDPRVQFAVRVLQFDGVVAGLRDEREVGRAQVEDMGLRRLDDVALLDARGDEGGELLGL